jgi:hypothetical protein
MRPSPTNKEREIEDSKETQVDHPKVPRQKLSPKNRIFLDKTALPKGLLSKNPEKPANSTRVVMEQFGKPEKYALSPARKTSNRCARGKKVSTRREEKDRPGTRKPDEPDFSSWRYEF